MVTDEDAVEIRLAWFERAAFLFVAVAATLGFFQAFLFPSQTSGTASQHILWLTFLLLLWWIGISDWIVASQRVCRADASGVTMSSSDRMWPAFLPFYKYSKPKFVAWNQIAALEWRERSGSKRPTLVLVDAEGEILLRLNLLSSRPKSERDRFLNFIQAKIDANDS